MNRPDYNEGAVPADLAQDIGDDSDPGDGSSAGAIVISAQGGAGERVDRFLAAQLASRIDGVSRSRIQQWIALGAVGCEQRAISASTRLAGYEILSVEPLPREADLAYEPDPVDLAIVDEDQGILVIDKPAGLVVHPAVGNWRNTLLNGLLFHRPRLATLPRAGIVHRLDKDTSGLMVVAKTEGAVASLTRQLADRTMSRRYLAFVSGTVSERVEIDVAIGRDPRSRTRMAALDSAGGKPARTFVRRLATIRLDGRDASLVECRLDTGRTHQIRVHMKHIGHPVVGDAVYGGPAGSIARQALHAWRLGLLDPADARAREWTRAPPPDMQALSRSGGIDLGEICDELQRRGDD